MPIQDTPRLLKGALDALDALNPPPRVVAFQYNPDTLARTLQVQGAADGGERAEAFRLAKVAVETLKVDTDDGVARIDHSLSVAPVAAEDPALPTWQRAHPRARGEASQPYPASLTPERICRAQRYFVP